MLMVRGGSIEEQEEEKEEMKATIRSNRMERRRCLNRMTIDHS